MGRRSSKIANRKGKEDKARAKIYGRIGKQIVAACAPAALPSALARSSPRAAPPHPPPPLSHTVSRVLPFPPHFLSSVKAGGPSENSNSRLAAVLDQARLNSVPKARQTLHSSSPPPIPFHRPLQLLNYSLPDAPSYLSSLRTSSSATSRRPQTRPRLTTAR